MDMRVPSCLHMAPVSGSPSARHSLHMANSSCWVMAATGWSAGGRTTTFSLWDVDMDWKKEETRVKL